MPGVDDVARKEAVRRDPVHAVVIRHPPDGMGRSPIHVRAPFRRVVDAIRRVGGHQRRRGPTQQGVDVRGVRAVAAPDHMRLEPKLVPEPDRGRPRYGGGIWIGLSRGGGVTAHGRPPFRSGPVSLKAGILVGVRGQRRVPRAQLARAVVVDNEARLLCGGEARALHEDRRVPSVVTTTASRYPTCVAASCISFPARIVRASSMTPDRAAPTRPSEAFRKSIPRDVCVRGLSVSGVSVSRGTTSTVTAGSAVGVGAASAPAGAVSRSRVPVVPFVISGHDAPFTINVAAARAMGRDLMLRRSMIEESKNGIELECVARARAKIAALSREALGPRSGFPDDRGGRGRPSQGIDHAHKGRREYVHTGRRSGLAFEHVDDAAATVGERRAGVLFQGRQNASMHNTVYPRHVALLNRRQAGTGGNACVNAGESREAAPLSRVASGRAVVAGRRLALEAVRDGIHGGFQRVEQFESGVVHPGREGAPLVLQPIRVALKPCEEDSGQRPSGLRLHLVHVCSPLLDQQRTVLTLPQVTDQFFDINADRAEDAKELPPTGEIARMTIVKHDRGPARLSGRAAARGGLRGPRPANHWISSVPQRRSYGPVIAVCSPWSRRGTPGPRWGVRSCRDVGPSKPRVAGSNPAWRAIFLENSPMVPTAWAPGAKIQANKVTGPLPRLAD